MPRLKAGMDEVEELREIEWKAGLAFTSYGLRIGVRVNDATLLDKLLPQLPPLWKPARASVVDKLYSIVERRKVGGRYRLYVDDERVAGFASRASLLDYFEGQVQLYVAEFAPGRVFVHAGVVGWRGRAILIPGRSYSGKTSLVGALVRAGATYYSDEYAVFDERGVVHPYPRRLSFREGKKKIRNTRRAVEELGGKVGRKPLPVGLVVMSKYKEGARFRPSELSAGEGVLALLDNTLSVRRQPEVALRTMKQAIAGARIIKSPRGEASALAKILLHSGGWE